MTTSIKETIFQKFKKHLFYLLQYNIVLTNFLIKFTDRKYQTSKTVGCEKSSHNVRTWQQPEQKYTSSRKEDIEEVDSKKVMKFTEKAKRMKEQKDKDKKRIRNIKKSIKWKSHKMLTPGCLDKILKVRK